MQGTLQQQSIEVEDALVVQELFYQNEWTDGLPVVPPTKDKIESMLETVPMDPQTIIGTIPERGSVFTLEVAACLLYTSPSPRDLSTSRMPSSA